MIVGAIIIAALVLLYLLALRGRTGHPWMAELRKWKYAHRGLHGSGVPENSMAAFRKALDSGYGIELDLHLLTDGNLAVIHDSSLKRTVGQEGKIEDLATKDLSKCFLEGTSETIPTFRQVLDLFDGKAPLIVELKPNGDNYAALAATACEMLKDYKGLYCIESFDPRCIRWLKTNRPHIVRGQLAYNSLHEQSEYPRILRFLMTNLFSNFWNVPDFIAYDFSNRNLLNIHITRKIWRVQAVAWTLRTPDDFDTAVNEGWIPIFEGFQP